MTYADDLARVGLHPDNPDQMYSELQKFLTHPVDFKNADKNWRGARDSKTWWEDPKGVAALQWPFHGGKWLDNVPKNDAQMRAVFKIPANVGTKQFLARVYGFPFVSSMSYSLRYEEWKQGNDFDKAWNGVKDGVNSIAGVADTLKIPGANLYASLLTGQDPIAALNKDLKNFTDSAAIAKGIATGDTSALKSAISSGAAKYGISLPPAMLDAAVSAAKSGDIKGAAMLSMGPGYANAWKVATHDGTLFDANLPAPPGLSYAPGTVPAVVTNLNAHPAIAAANKIPLAVALKAQPLKNELPPQAKALIIAQTGIDPKLLSPKKKSWWQVGGAAGGAAAGFAVGGPVGAAVGAGLGFLGGRLFDK